MKTTSRTFQLKILLSDEERERLRAMAEAHGGLDVSSFVRLWIRGLLAPSEGKRDDRRRTPFIAAAKASRR